MPCDYKQYPKNWKKIVERLKEKRGNKCELCFAPNKAKVWRDYSPTIHPWYPSHMIPDENIKQKEGRFVKGSKNSAIGKLILVFTRFTF